MSNKLSGCSRGSACLCQGQGAGAEAPLPLLCTPLGPGGVVGLDSGPRAGPVLGPTSKLVLPIGRGLCGAGASAVYCVQGWGHIRCPTGGLGTSLGTQLLFALWQDILSEQMSLFARIDLEHSRTKGCSLWAHLHPNRWLLWAQDGPLWSPSVLYPWTAVPTWLQVPPFLPPLSISPTPGAAVPLELAAPYRPALCMCSSPECRLPLCGTPGSPRGPAPLGPPRSGCFLPLTPGPAGWGWRYTLGPPCHFLLTAHSSQKPRPQLAPLSTATCWGHHPPRGHSSLCLTVSS